MAEEHGYRNLEECIAENTELKAGDKVYVNQMGKALALFQIGQRPLEEGILVLILPALSSIGNILGL